jgi:hypothetical protein
VQVRKSRRVLEPSRVWVEKGRFAGLNNPVTPDAFRKLALGLPGAHESSHMAHPDFRVGKRVFATLSYPDVAWGMVKLTPAQQRSVVRAHPAVFTPVKGGWGRGGATNVKLRLATAAVLRPALEAAWQNVAPPRPRRGSAGH